MALRKHTYINFKGAKPQCATNAVGQIAVTTDAATNFVQVGAHALELYNEEANAKIIPVMLNDADSTAGLELPVDNTDNNGVELSLGIVANNVFPYAFKVGTDPAFQLKVKLAIPDVSDYDVVTVGFRKAAAYADIAAHAAAITAYEDVAAFNINIGDIFTATRLAGGTGTLTDTTDNWADDAVKELTINVSATGVATFLIDGAAPTVNTNTVTLTNGAVMVPFIHATKNASVATDTPPILEYLICGYQ